VVDPLPGIALCLASALRNMPCTCISIGSWPLFKLETKVHKPKKCSRCLALEKYDAYVSIVQLPRVKQ
jgi:hypothetical protein